MQTVRLSQISRDPALAAFFERGERDSGAAYAVPTRPKPTIIGGAANTIEQA